MDLAGPPTRIAAAVGSPRSTPAPAEQAPPARLRGILSLQDFEAAARRYLPHALFSYAAGGCEDGVSLRDNRSAYDAWRLVPRVLVDITARTQEVQLWGERFASPFGIAPMGSCALFAYRGDLVLAEAARRAGIPMVLSGASLIALEEVVQQNPGAWFQAYLPGQESTIRSLLARVVTAGIETLVITADTPVAANRENNVRAGFSTPLRPTMRLAWQGVTHPRWLLGTFLQTLARHGMPRFVNVQVGSGIPVLSRHAERAFADRGSFDWDHLRLIRRLWRGRLVLKGVLHPEDAVAARDSGCDAVMVSNHGGRQLDGALGPLEALPRIVDACANFPILLDGGVRRGTDVLKALGLGARMVFVGRPFMYAAAVGGLPGAGHAIALLREEISRNMGMMGITALKELSRARHLARAGCN